MGELAIISRSFWPDSAIIGEALLQLAENRVQQGGRARVVALVGRSFRQRLTDERRRQGVGFSVLPRMTTSASPIPLRIVELVLFTLYTFLVLCWYRPATVYVATNPPVFTPLMVRVYCTLFRRKYIYHLQDIHPEITQVVTGKSNVLTRLLQRIDIRTVAQADTVITLTEQMREYVQRRSQSRSARPRIVLLDNPAVQSVATATPPRQHGIVYCGNAGRLQHIPLLLDAIEHYVTQGGTLPFTFAGGGIHVNAIKALAERFDQVHYLGVLPGNKAAELMQSYTYGLMPIVDEVTDYAFPSKSSSYVFSGCRVIAICGAGTSVAQWVGRHQVGVVVAPRLEAIIEAFQRIEAEAQTHKPVGLELSQDFRERLTPEAHARALERIIQGLMDF